MKLKTHPHRSDLLTLTKDDLDRIAAGEILQVSALVISLEDEPKPDVVRWCWATTNMGTDRFNDLDNHPNLKLTLDGETGKLKSAEVL